MVEPVAISPICSVTADSADNSVNGSNEVTVWLRFNAEIGMFSTARWSAMKKASNFPALQFLDQALDVREIEIGVRPCAGIAPCAGMNADRPHERAKPQLTFCHFFGVRVVSR